MFTSSSKVNWYKLGAEGDIKKLEAAIRKHKGGINGLSVEISNALRSAVYNGQTDMVVFLLNQGTDIYAIDELNSTILYQLIIGFACAKGKQNLEVFKEILRILLDHEVELRDKKPIKYMEHPLLKDIKDHSPWLPLERIKLMKEIQEHAPLVKELFEQQARKINALQAKEAEAEEESKPGVEKRARRASNSPERHGHKSPKQMRPNLPKEETEQEKILEIRNKSGSWETCTSFLPGTTDMAAIASQGISKLTSAFSSLVWGSNNTNLEDAAEKQGLLKQESKKDI